MAEAREADPTRAVRRYGLPALILATGAALASLVAGIAFAGTQRNAFPSVVLKWNGLDAGARAVLAERLIAAGAPEEADRREAIRLATEALLRDPTQVRAARALGMVAAVEGDSDHATRLLDYAESLSRRDVPTQLWLIERKVQLGDIWGTLRHYDAVLRTSPTGQQLLFPVLVRAVDEPLVFEDLKVLVARKPPWARAFIGELIASRAKAEHVVGLALTVLDGSERDDETLRQRLLARLVDRGEFDAAYDTYASFMGASAANLALRNGSFEQALRYPPIDWEVAAEPDFAALPQPASGGNGLALYFHAAAGRGGVLARQLLHLPAGPYRLSAVVGNIPAGRAERPSLELRCANQSTANLRTFDFPEADAEGRSWQVVFAVPVTQCDYQWLTIRSRGTFDEPAEVPWVDRLTIKPNG